MKNRITISLLLCLTVLSGCWGRTELKEIGIVSGMGIDKGKETNFEFTTQSIYPTAAMKDVKPTSIIVKTSKGDTIFEAIRDLIISTKRRQNLQHIHSLVIGKEIAEEGVIPVIDLFIRDHEPRLSMDLFLAEDKAKDILEIQNKHLPIPSLIMKEAVEEHESLAKAPQMKLHNFYQRLVEPYSDPYLPIVHKKNDDFEVYGTGIFKEDKLVGELNSIETRGMLRVLGEVKSGIQVVQLATTNEKPVNISIEIKGSKSSLKTYMKNGKPTMQINIQESGFIGDMSQKIVLNEKTIKEINKLYEEAIEKEVKQSVSKIQKEFNANIFDFAGTIRRSENKYWKEHKDQWEEIYPTLTVKVNVKTEIKATGLEEDMSLEGTG
ncbi:Ger(x)C family spore germination protein [Calidifontibacillus erzurumensis]|uniref:Ger(X)C family spore germination protein n=1 Tax=Calidifontibacillus erzurumensis TaxID=2741433 RepID=A0A8J8GIR2_9BACI|nr:Ger(x)C family spore germination protein [Calidifontibacillus erzurumensis]NSL53075.1 Ger(x)C family spore germination protein [Calidifontibacillus erzurumensis]